jgi:hypothetical protein
VCGRNDTVAVSGDMVPRRGAGTGRLEGAAPGLRMQSIASTHIWQIRSGLGACLMRKQGSREAGEETVLESRLALGWLDKPR